MSPNFEQHLILQTQPSRDEDGRERRHTGAGAAAAVFAVPGVGSGTAGTKLIQQQPTASPAVGERAAAVAAPEMMGSRVQQQLKAAPLGGKKIITNADATDGTMAAGQGELTFEPSSGLMNGQQNGPIFKRQFKITVSQPPTQHATVRGRTLERTPSGKSKPAMASVPVNVIPPTPAQAATSPSIPMFPEASNNQ